MTQPIDGHDIADLEDRLRETCRDLGARTEVVANAKQVQKFAEQTERSLVAKYMVKFLDAGHNVGKAKIYAMAEPGYLKEFENLKEVFQSAQKVIEDYEVAHTKWESARSLLSIAKAQIQPSFQQQRSHA